MELRDVHARDVFASKEFGHIVEAYAAESGNPDLGEATPVLEFYERMEQAESLRFVAAFDGDKIIGVVVVVATLYPHFGKKVASCESLWLDKAYRDGYAGLKLIRKAQEVAREMGAVGIYFGARTGSRLARLYERIFTPMNTLFWKKL